ncbi:MAG: Holliday junction resolvase RuvX [Erysipelotrichaceae bacterium]|nr:Holliday junction resolvase RuvX [Erysipelotrichaceae bacterium]
MRALGCDLGSKTLGLSVSDLSGFLASPYSTIRFQSDDYQNALDQLMPILEKEKITVIVLGLPKHMNGSLGESADRSIYFKEELELRTSIEVVLEDERLSTVAAQKSMLMAEMNRQKRKTSIDQMAATFILQGYLDKMRHKRG